MPTYYPGRTFWQSENSSHLNLSSRHRMCTTTQQYVFKCLLSLLMAKFVMMGSCMGSQQLVKPQASHTRQSWLILVRPGITAGCQKHVPQLARCLLTCQQCLCREHPKLTMTCTMQRQRPATALASSSSTLGPGWYHVRHTATEKEPHSVQLKARARPASTAVKPAAHSGRSDLTR